MVTLTAFILNTGHSSIWESALCRAVRARRVPKSAMLILALTPVPTSGGRHTLREGSFSFKVKELPGAQALGSLPTWELTNITSNFIDKESGRLGGAVRQREKSTELCWRRQNHLMPGRGVLKDVWSQVEGIKDPSERPGATEEGRQPAAGCGIQIGLGKDQPQALCHKVPSC